MNPISILLLGLAMSTDAFAAALGKGAGMRKPSLREALRVGLIFGVVEALVGKRAEIAGGVILVLVGSVILYQHLSTAAM